MKKVKYLIALICIVLLTGCTSEYKAKIMLDGSIEESAIITETISDLSDEKLTKEEVESYIEKTGKQLKVDFDMDSYEYSEDEFKITVNKKYDDIYDFKENSKAINYLFSKITINDTNRFVIKVTSNYSDYEIDESYYGSTIEISLPFKVTENNADEYDESTNTYKWVVDKDFDGIRFNYDKYIYFTYNPLVLINYATFSTYLTIFSIIILILAFIILIKKLIYYIKELKKNGEIKR